MNHQATLKKLYVGLTGAEPTAMTMMPRSGSNRTYYRIEGPRQLVGAVGVDRRENEAFIYMSRHFKSKGLPVPAVVAESDDHMAYLQEDLGNDILFGCIEKSTITRSFNEHDRMLLSRTIRMLCRMQFEGARGFDFTRCYPAPSFDRRMVMWDLNYFKYCFLKATGLEFDESRLEDDFDRLADVLLANMSDTFMYRDFQARNVMIVDDQPWFIDFQGGRKGPFYYDVASFLWQARARYTKSLRAELIGEYLDELSRYASIERTHFESQLRYFVLFRTLQVLGAYGFRGYFEKKPHFLKSVPAAIENMSDMLHETPFVEFPYLNEVLSQMVTLPQFTAAIKQPLTVTVTSFPFKKGYPVDTSGNGGGFVFDCRAIDNPGKYDRYKPMTGVNPEVVKYLEDNGEIVKFLEHAYALVDASVQRYIDRKFTHLMVSFGCTGGQHRSVYCAEHMARHLNEKFNVHVVLTHSQTPNFEELEDRELLPKAPL